MAVQDDAALGGTGASARSRSDYLAWLERVPPAYWVLAVVLLFMPAVASNFWLFQVWGWAFILGMIALSLTFLAGYGGMVSLAQMTIAGLAGYMVAVFGVSGVASISLGWPLWVAVPVAILIAAVFGTLTGALAVRTRGIYTIMITLAVAAGFFYLTRQNYTIFNGYSGFGGIQPPYLFGLNLRQPVHFYYLTLVCAVLSFLAVVYVSRSPFGLALQGVRDNPRRMAALGFNVTAHRIAAYTFASVIAAFGGILLVWQNAQISPGTAGVPAVIDILVIAIVGGIRRPIGPFIGALIYVLLRTFSPDVLSAFDLSNERFKLLIGLGFLAVVFFSPDGVLGLWDRWRARMRRRDALTQRLQAADRLLATGPEEGVALMRALVRDLRSPEEEPYD
jgi:branched-chain amino acid transport system permease protein